jgi:serine/threonine protein kinase
MKGGANDIDKFMKQLYINSKNFIVDEDYVDKGNLYNDLQENKSLKLNLILIKVATKYYFVYTIEDHKELGKLEELQLLEIKISSKRMAKSYSFTYTDKTVSKTTINELYKNFLNECEIIYQNIIKDDLSRQQKLITHLQNTLLILKENDTKTHINLLLDTHKKSTLIQEQMISQTCNIESMADFTRIINEESEYIKNVKTQTTYIKLSTKYQKSYVTYILKKKLKELKAKYESWECINYILEKVKTDLDGHSNIYMVIDMIKTYIPQVKTIVKHKGVLTSKFDNITPNKKGVIKIICNKEIYEIREPILEPILEQFTDYNYEVTQKNVKVLGKGTFNSVCALGTNNKDGKNYIIKLQKPRMKSIFNSSEMAGKQLQMELLRKPNGKKFITNTLSVGYATANSTTDCLIPKPINPIDCLSYSIEEKGVNDVYDLTMIKKSELYKGITLLNILEMVNCIKFLHDNNIVHRDIKPENFMMFEDKIKIIDFGISIIFKKGILDTTKLTINNDGVSNFTEEEYIIQVSGTRGYMAPEQKTENIDFFTAYHEDQLTLEDYKKRDIYSFGIILQELVDSIHLNTINEHESIIKRIMEDLQALINSCIHENYKERSTIYEFITSLKEAFPDIEIANTAYTKKTDSEHSFKKNDVFTDITDIKDSEWLMGNLNGSIKIVQKSLVNTIL